MRYFTLLLVLTAASMIGMNAYADCPCAQARVVNGESKTLGNGTIHSWVRVGNDGKPVAIGVTFSESALAGLPGSHTETVLPLPREVAFAPFNHIGVDWNPMGHIPPHIYDVPHFDFHFYMINLPARQSITVQGEDLQRAYKPVASEFVPVGYILAPESHEPRMGVHWIDPGSPEFHGTPFTSTFIYGSYNGHVVFLEPMVTLAFLKTNPDFTESIRQPSAYETAGYYPTGYRVVYNPDSKEYTVAMNGLVMRS